MLKWTHLTPFDSSWHNQQFYFESGFEFGVCRKSSIFWDQSKGSQSSARPWTNPKSQTDRFWRQRPQGVLSQTGTFVDIGRLLNFFMSCPLVHLFIFTGIGGCFMSVRKMKDFEKQPTGQWEEDSILNVQKRKSLCKPCSCFQIKLCSRRNVLNRPPIFWTFMVSKGVTPCHLKYFNGSGWGGGNSEAECAIALTRRVIIW